MSTEVYKCHGIKDIGTRGICKETDPDNFLKGSTTKCLECHSTYQRAWYYANKRGLKVSDIEVSGEPHKAKVTVKSKKTDESKRKSVDWKALGDVEKLAIAKDKKIAKLEKELNKANDEIATLRDWMQQMTVSADFTLYELDASDSGDD